MLKLSDRDLEYVTGATEPLWRDLEGARLFVTGGTGFFGIWLLETFLAARDRLGVNAEAVVLTRNRAAFEAKAPHLAPRVRCIEGDVRNFAFPEGEFPFVIHAATEASATLNEQQPREMFTSIVNGTERVLEFAQEARTRRLLFVSSGAVYGRQPERITHLDEDYTGAPVTTDPRSAYGEGKRAAELLCAMSAVPTAIARCFAFVGPHLPLDRHFAIGNFIFDALAGRTIRVRGDGTPLRSYLYAADLAVWLWTILSRGTALRPYNVGSDEAVSVGRLAQIVAGTVEPALAVEVAGTPDPSTPVERYVPSTVRARTELGLAQSVDLGDAIARTIDWHRRSQVAVKA
jgi:nucleoside-diphosphate-sugar epimerase